MVNISLEIKNHKIYRRAGQLSPLVIFMENLNQAQDPSGRNRSKELKEGIGMWVLKMLIGFRWYNYQSEKLINEAFFENMNRGKIENKDILIYKDGAYIGATNIVSR
ncbi:MAG: hypothetical protein U0T81_03690 [Saprospiraceae bacterium]